MQCLRILKKLILARFRNSDRGLESSVYNRKSISPSFLELVIHDTLMTNSQSFPALEKGGILDRLPKFCIVYNIHGAEDNSALCRLTIENLVKERPGHQLKTLLPFDELYSHIEGGTLDLYRVELVMIMQFVCENHYR